MNMNKCCTNIEHNDSSVLPGDYLILYRIIINNFNKESKTIF